MNQRRKHQNRRGTALVEMALVLPIFLMVVLGVIEFGRAMMVSQIVTNAAREGARSAVVDGSSNAAVTSSIEDFLEGAVGIAPEDVDVTITVDNPAAGNEIANAETRDLITVEVEVPFEKVQYIAGKYLADKNLRAVSAMRHE